LLSNRFVLAKKGKEKRNEKRRERREEKRRRKRREESLFSNQFSAYSVQIRIWHG